MPGEDSQQAPWGRARGLASDASPSWEGDSRTSLRRGGTLALRAPDSTCCSPALETRDSCAAPRPGSSRGRSVSAVGEAAVSPQRSRVSCRRPQCSARPAKALRDLRSRRRPVPVDRMAVSRGRWAQPDPSVHPSQSGWHGRSGPLLEAGCPRGGFSEQTVCAAPVRAGYPGTGVRRLPGNVRALRCSLNVNPAFLPFCN